jgi:hypothetical protein
MHENRKAMHFLPDHICGKSPKGGIETTFSRYPWLGCSYVSFPFSNPQLEAAWDAGDTMPVPSANGRWSKGAARIPF